MCAYSWHFPHVTYYPYFAATQLNPVLPLCSPSRRTVPGKGIHGSWWLGAAPSICIPLPLSARNLLLCIGTDFSEGSPPPFSCNWIVAVVVIALLPFLKSSSIPGQRMLPPTSPLIPDPPPDGSAAIPNSSLCLAAGHLAAFNALSAAAALPILRILNWFPSRLFYSVLHITLRIFLLSVRINFNIPCPSPPTNANAPAPSPQPCNPIFGHLVRVRSHA